MKLLAFVSVIFLITSVSCQKKSLPAITGREAGSPIRTVFSYPPASTAAPDTIQGKAIFMARCSRCHGLPDPHQYTEGRWDVILESMLPRTRMSNANAVHVRAYVLANAVKQ